MVELKKLSKIFKYRDKVKMPVSFIFPHLKNGT